jgi:hypothetical protein
MTPWQEVRALAEKWREDASHADEAAAATDNLLLDAEIYGAAVAKRACASELDVLIRDPAFIGMMEAMEGEVAGLRERLATQLEKVAHLAARLDASMNESAETRTDLQAAEARAVAAEQDARRYRWLRQAENQGARTKDGAGLIVCTDRPGAEFARYIGPIFGPNLDAAIDTARASSAGEGE